MSIVKSRFEGKEIARLDSFGDVVRFLFTDGSWAELEIRGYHIAETDVGYHIAETDDSRVHGGVPVHGLTELQKFIFEKQFPTNVILESSKDIITVKSNWGTCDNFRLLWNEEKKEWFVKE